MNQGKPACFSPTSDRQGLAGIFWSARLFLTFNLYIFFIVTLIQALVEKKVTDGNKINQFLRRSNNDIYLRFSRNF